MILMLGGSERPELSVALASPFEGPQCLQHTFFAITLH